MIVKVVKTIITAFSNYLQLVMIFSAFLENLLCLGKGRSQFSPRSFIPITIWKMLQYKYLHVMPGLRRLKRPSVSKSYTWNGAEFA